MHTKIIKPELLEICRHLSSSKLKDLYYLAGGTGLALQIGHRTADDLSFFSMNRAASMDAVSILKLMKLLFPHDTVRIDLKLSDQLEVYIGMIKICFVTYDYPLLNPLLEGSHLTPACSGLKFASVQDIALMKSLDIVRRPCFIDYIDLYFLLQTEQVDLAYILSNADRKFAANNKIDFYIRRLLERLRYPPETPDKAEAISKISADPPSAEDIEMFLEQTVLTYMQGNALHNHPKLE